MIKYFNVSLTSSLMDNYYCFSHRKFKSTTPIAIQERIQWSISGVKYCNCKLQIYDKLEHNKLTSLQCQHIRSLDNFFDDIQMDPVEIAVVGCGCTVATEPVAEISHRWSIPQVQKFNCKQLN